MRGTQHRYHIAVVIRGIIPACAGNTSLSVRVVSVRRDHPRMCGEHNGTIGAEAGTQGSSPHVRGARRVRSGRAKLLGIIPACAGSTRPDRRPRGARRDHPRMCGEHLHVGRVLVAFQGSSPHVRGARDVDTVARLQIGIIPACAGSTQRKRTPRPHGRDHPRMCGEHAAIQLASSAESGSSPHVRGARRLTLNPRPAAGIIPACAGSTGWSRRSWFCPRDHPRMCGEH